MAPSKKETAASGLRSTRRPAPHECRFAAAQHRRACVPPFEIIGLCGIALIFAAVMLGSR